MTAPPWTLQARARLVAETGNPHVFVHLVDMTDTRAVAALGRDFAANAATRPLHVLVNNAGVLLPAAAVAANGLEASFAVNVAGTLALTEALLPALATQPDARVVVVSSGGLLLERLEPRDVQLAARFARAGAYNGELAYAQHKRQQAVLTAAWAAAHPAVGVYCYHPGWADTPGVATALPGFRERMGGRLRSPAQGADCGVWLCLAPRAKLASGAFYRDRAVESLHLPAPFGLGSTASSAADVAEYLATVRALVAPLAAEASP